MNKSLVLSRHEIMKYVSIYIYIYICTYCIQTISPCSTAILPPPRVVGHMRILHITPFRIKSRRVFRHVQYRVTCSRLLCSKLCLQWRPRGAGSTHLILCTTVMRQHVSTHIQAEQNNKQQTTQHSNKNN